MIKHLDIFSFNEYRDYLRTWLKEARKSKTSNLSQVSKALGLHTTYLSQVLAGLKTLSLDQAIALSELLSLTKIER